MTSQALDRPADMTVPQLLILLFGRLAFNTGFRIIYPLLPVLAAGLGVSLGVASLLVTVQVAATMLSPLGGALSDARGERLTMTVGLVGFCAGALVCALTVSFPLFLVGYVLIGVGTALYMPAVQAYASARSDYGQRGRVLGTLELSWALAALVGVAGLTQLIALRGSWAPAFWALLALGLLMLALTLTLPDAGGARRQRAEGAPAPRGVWRRPGILAALGLIFCQMLAAELIFVVYASWLQGDFGASTDQLGLIFGLLGFVELAGSIGATLFTDRIGKRRAVVLGFLAVAVLQALLPLSGGSWALFLVLFLLFDLCFEFSIVSAFPLVSGLTEDGRGTVLALVVAMSGLGRVVGSLLGPQVFAAVGFAGNGLLAGAAALVGALVCLRFVREGDH
ncbi:MFS transporter [Oscillochloris sp. ZM17-4]|uniref:MFS transporter n=1 Tax=Oscillochloris sp. ZM17-4 TaxID=2866714 RepID=UPI001C731ACE|nr:MFS transporter [Oscillochloris sp. ZM17-4]MBX0327622.1 MFS transporter [Oscillochloris sp. ZM17-4]